MTSNDPQANDKAATGSSADQLLLDDALRNADQLLVESLHVEDDRRRKKRILTRTVSGGFIMLAIICFLLLWPATQQDTVDTANKPLAQETAEAKIDVAKSAQVAGEGWVLWQKQQFAAAVEKFKQATELNPDNANAWNGLGWASFNGGDSNAAQAAFHRVIELEPKHPAALNGLGQIAFFSRKYDEAEKYLLKAAPQAPAAWYALAKLYLLQGDYPAAAKWTRKIANSGDTDPAIQRMQTAAKEKDLPEDLRKLIEPPETTPQSADVVQAWRLMNTGRMDDARELFEAVLKEAPETFGAVNGLGWLSLNTGELNEAKTYFERALKIEPEAPGPMNGLASVLYAQDDVESAMDLWQVMVDKFPGPNAGTVNLANAYLQKDEYQQAIPLLEELVEADPNNQDARAKLAHAREQLKQQ